MAAPHMFPFGLSFGTLAVLLVSLALALLGCITAGVFVLTWAFAAVALLGLLMIRDPERTMRRVGASLLAVVALGVALAVHVAPAHAGAVADLVWHEPAFSAVSAVLPGTTPGTITAPPADDGFWSGINGYLVLGVTTVVGAFATWALKEIATHTRLKIRSDQEAEIRETMRTGAFAAMSELELQIDKRWTPAQRQAVIRKVVGWAQDRAAAQLGRLGLPGFVVNAMASKVVGGVLAAYPFLDVGEMEASTRNPGSTPALDHAVGGNGGN